MRMHVDEGYQIEAAREMSYDPENVETYAARLDTFRSDWFDAAEVSQAMRMQSPAVPATPTEGKDDEKKTDVKLESKENEDKPTE